MPSLGRRHKSHSQVVQSQPLENASWQRRQIVVVEFPEGAERKRGSTHLGAAKTSHQFGVEFQCRILCAHNHLLFRAVCYIVASRQPLQFPKSSLSVPSVLSCLPTPLVLGYVSHAPRAFVSLLSTRIACQHLQYSENQSRGRRRGTHKSSRTGSPSKIPAGSDIRALSLRLLNGRSSTGATHV